MTPRAGEARVLTYTSRANVEGHEVVELSDGWEAAPSPPGECEDTAGLDRLRWRPAVVPGTAAAALADATTTCWDVAPSAVDEQDWWFRRPLDVAPAEAFEQLLLVFDGLATVAEVYVGGERVLTTESMFAVSAVDVTAIVAPDSELAICFRALGPLLRVSRRPRARWRSGLVDDNALRFWRTMIVGRSPGFASGPPVVGPWRPVRLERRRTVGITELRVRPRVTDDGGVLAVRMRLHAIAGASEPERVSVELAGPGGPFRGELELEKTEDGLRAAGEILVPGAALWWPHTHGDPALYGVTLTVEGAAPVAIDGGRVGFRTLAAGEDIDTDGLALRVNGVSVFARGALWTPLEVIGLATEAPSLRSVLELVRAAGMNMLRLPGFGAYESAAFHDLCDELGILVWQDFMFCSLDYPQSDAAFLQAARREILQLLEEVGGRASLTVLCGSSEVPQQVAMLGLDPDLATGPLYDELLPELVAHAELDAIYLSSTPSGGFLPFRPDRGIADYFGVGGYLRPLEDARRSGVRFAAECLAFANVPGEAVIDELGADARGGLAVHHPRWKVGVSRDPGLGWDGDDVRDHYLGSLFEVDPTGVRQTDWDRYLELSRAVTGEVMAEVFGEWRRAASPCGGGLIEWLHDLRPGAGWGLLDYRGRPKAAYHHVRRASAPLAVWSSDEGLSGFMVHVANDGAGTVAARLRVSLYRNFEVPVGEAVRELSLAPHATCEYDAQELLGRFVDISWSYRFGPPAQDVVAFTLEATDGDAADPLSQSFRLPAGRRLERETATRLGLSATITPAGEDSSLLSIRTRRFAYGVRVHVPGWQPTDDAFSVEPGGERRIVLTSVSGELPGGGAVLTALNLIGRMPISTTSG